ncbi:MAG: hypothetical protein JXR40_07090 [Pontiellaceae bacterium]|nr:hypothetical protein [Pontiellaceae bacterium]
MNLLNWIRNKQSVKKNELELYGDDENHPIPTLNNLDVMGTFEDGRTSLAIIVSSPLLDDQRSQKRLLKKMENYLMHVNSSEFEAQFGKPSIEKTLIDVSLHPDSSPVIVELIGRCKDWAHDNHADIIISRLQTT